MQLPKVSDVREHFKFALAHEQFVTDKTGVKTIELIGASFLADEPTIFGPVNHDYVSREIAWYNSTSRNVYDIPGGPPKIWQQVATKDGLINSNYGWCIFSVENGEQYKSVVETLVSHPESRRAVMIYTRPSMQTDYNADGMSDFMCTNAVQYLIRDGKLHSVVQMRSNDAWAGYRNDFAWQKEVQRRLIKDLNTRSGNQYIAGDIFWQVGSLHLYSRQFYLVDHYDKTGEFSISKEKYEKVYAKHSHFDK